MSSLLQLRRRQQSDTHLSNRNIHRARQYLVHKKVAKALGTQAPVIVQKAGNAVQIYLFALCYNEAFIIPHFLQHYSYVDKIFIYDNGSTDESLALLQKDTRCHITPFRSKFDDTINQYIKNNCWKKYRGICDYAIVCDIDEFLWFTPTMNVREMLQQHKTLNRSLDYCPIKGYNMVSITPITDDTLVKQVTHGVPDTMYSKHILFNVNTVREMNYSTGSHTFKIYTYARKRLIGPQLSLLHYKFIGGKKRLRQRYLDYRCRLSSSNKKRREGLHYLRNPDIEYNSLLSRCSKIL